MYNLSTVIKFEIIRTLKKKTYWFMALGFPIVIGAVFGIIYLSSQASSQASAELEQQKFSIEVTDHSGLIKPSILTALGASSVSDKDQAIADVKSGKIDAYFYYPKHLDQQPIEVYGQDVGLFENGRYSGVADTILSQSVDTKISPEIQAVIAGHTSTKSTTYKAGVVSDPVRQMILPGIFLVLFYLLIAFMGNQMLTSTTEEKENRVIEMILTTITARTLIVGKIISLVLLSLLQGLIIFAPVLAGYLLFHNQLNLPDFDLSSLPVDWVRIVAGFVIFLVGFLLFTGLLVLVGASVPTAKEAGQFFGLFMVLIFGPLYAFSLFITSPDSPFVQFLSLFPLTSPIPLLLRNAIGNLTLWQGVLGVGILVVTTVVVMALAIRVFRYGALEYSRRLSLREIVRR